MTSSDTAGKVLVLGAGPVGLSLAKHLKEAGVAYDQVDAADDVGGNWHHGVYKAAHIISSRKTTEYADFPMPETYPDFPSRVQMLEYFRAYADRFGLRDHLELHKEVTRVEPGARSAWEVTFQGGERRTYKAVCVCNGHHWDRRFPSYPGTFEGEWRHSKDYRDPDELRGKRVLVIGGGNSACDIASEAARVGAKACISVRRGYWIVPKTVFGRPSVELLHPRVPVWAQRLVIRGILAVTVGDYRRYGLPWPDHKIFDKHPTISTEILFYLKQGTLLARPDVARFEGHDVVFEDGRRETFDVVVCATGFHLSFPFLAEGLIEVEGPVAKVYGGCMSAEHKHLYVVGTMQVRYGLGPVVTPLSQFLTQMIQLQDELAHPIGALLKDLGDKPPESHLVDPHASIRRLRWAGRYLPGLLRRRDKKLIKRRGGAVRQDDAARSSA